MTRTFALALLCSAALFAPAVAAKSPAQEAEHLQQVFQTYLGAQPGVVTVTPKGRAYEVRLNPGPLLALLAIPGFKLEAAPVALALEPTGGGHWRSLESLLGGERSRG